ncbi:hypothetical protein ACFV0C_28020 [Streptomyces sp. NPDC059568]|uniref:hypothetical protein n=1 Tax=Streptomyces sp. NPDC059568 TaxID=3346868 RepID=UPI0036C991DB
MTTPRKAIKNAIELADLGSNRAALEYLTQEPTVTRADLTLPHVLSGAVIRGTVSSVADKLYGTTRSAMLTAGQIQRASGRPDEAAQWSALARQLLMAGLSARRGRSVRTMSGGLPTLGKRG